jgi:hypothetical protein
MDQGSKKLAIILGIALLLGAVVVAFSPAYRQAFICIVKGQPDQSPIWKSNIDYYPDIVLPVFTTRNGEPSKNLHGGKPE